MTSLLELGGMWNWLRRLRARRRLERELGVWYHSTYAAPGMRESSRVPNLDPTRGETVISLLAAEGLLRAGDVSPSPLATIEELRLFHPMAYLESSGDPDVLARIFGLEPESVDVDRLLVSQRRAVGGTIAAARSVVAGERKIAINLGGGFHHAEHDRGSGFCVYNDIAVAIAVLRKEGFTGKIAIVDLDFHQGNGNLVGFAGDASVFNYSIHGSVWSHVEVPTAKQILLAPGSGDVAYLDVLRASLLPALDEHRAELVFYVAGNDVLRGDRLGTFNVSPDGVLLRDRHVLDVAETLGAGLVVTLGGGYSPAAWPVTANFLRFLLAGDERARPGRPTLRTHFERVARELDPADLQREGDDGEDAPLLTTDDIDAIFGGRTPMRRVLDYYTAQGVELAFERYGILQKVRDRGFEGLVLEVDPSDPAHQILRMKGKKGPNEPLLVLLELVVARVRRTLPALPSASQEGLPLDDLGAIPATELDLLSVEWLLLQDPTATFSLDRPQLPGQEHPGLGISEEIRELLIRVCHRLSLEGLLDRPAHFHNALGTMDAFHFLDPADEGRFLAMADVLAPLHRADAAKLVDEVGLVLSEGTVVRWTPADHALPVGERLTQYFSSPEYCAVAQAERRKYLAAGLQLPPRAEALLP